MPIDPSRPTVVRGDTTFYINPDYILAIESAIPEKVYEIDASSYIPADAKTMQVMFDAEGSYWSGTFGAQGGFIVQAVEGNNFLNISVYTAPVQYSTVANTLTAIMPVMPSRKFYIIFLPISGQFNPIEWPNMTISFLSYTK
jgi:hypothetical protein